MHTKKIYIFFIPVILLAALLWSCKKYETIPLEARTEGIVYDTADINGFYADQALTNLYTFLPKGFNRLDNAFLDDATDDGIVSQFQSNIDILSKGLQSPVQTVDEVFATSYTAIYRSNLFLSKIDTVPLTATVKQYYKAEARFIRAMMYFELIKRYGGVPLIGDKVLTLADNLNIARSSYTDCVNYIVGECDAISSLLRKEPVLATEVGRATQGAALSLKARTLLYAASPLNNTSNDVAKWQAAANAALAVINLGAYTLNAGFVTAFIARSDKEVILANQQAKNKTPERAQAPVGYTNDIDPSNGLTSPTQDLVDAFPMLNGKAITDATSGYTETAPYTGRDPRLSATVFFNGQTWLGRAVETFDGGKDKPNTGIVQTRTGYYLRKFLPDLSAATAYSAQDHNFIIFRYAEILLDYAEAINEAAPTNTALALAQLYNIRKRAGITAGTPAVYGITATTQAGIRDAIRLERRLELAFEEHRFWDERRWKTAETDFNKPLRGVNPTKNGTGFTYPKFNVSNLVFKLQMYLYPIPYSELLNNPALTQNPGW